MKRSSNLWVVVVFLLLLALGSLQGRRVDRLRDAERFYRWILSASNQMRLFGEPGHVPEGEDAQKFLDKQLFDKLVSDTESMLPDVPLAEGDYDKAGKPLPKIVQYTTVPKNEAEEKSEAEEGDIISPELTAHDRNLWQMAQGAELADLRIQFLQASHDGRIASATTLGLTDIYGAGEKGPISIANIFFGFRKMAANLVWLQVDRYFHQGMIHRMVPLMKTCVTLDPTFVDAYLLGSWHLSYNATASLDDTPWDLRKFFPKYYYWLGEKESFYFNGVEFLEDGIRNNPRNYKLYFDLGYGIYEEKLKDHRNAIRFLSDAIRMNHDVWVPRQLYRILGEDGQFEKSQKGWQNYLERQPKNQVAPRFIRLMQGSTKDRSADYAAEQARMAKELAKRFTDSGDTAQAAQWNQNAKAAEEQAAKLFTEARDYWQSILTESGRTDTYAQARLLNRQAQELRRLGRYNEAIVTIDQARWASNEFWDTATHLMMKYKQEGNIPLAVTEQRQIAREEQAADYTRHLPKSVGGKHFFFSDADNTWYQEEYRGEPLTTLKQDSVEFLKLAWDSPQATIPGSELDGNIVFQIGQKWYKYEASKPAIPSKTDGQLPPVQIAKNDAEK